VVRATPFQQGGTPWRGESPGELRALSSLTHCYEWRTLAWRKTLKTGVFLEAFAVVQVFDGVGRLFCAAGSWIAKVRQRDHNAKRVRALETVYGCAGGAKL
jgi:hypothetical protein